MKEKIPLDEIQWRANMEIALDLIEQGDSFLFAGDMDGDSIGSMISLALYFQLLDKEAHLILTEGLGENLDYLQKIIDYNAIHTLASAGEVAGMAGEIDTIIFFDTANSKLVPLYPVLREHLLSEKLPVIEIDHHFGADSEEMLPHSVKLFRLANANTEIIAEIFTQLKKRDPHLPDPFGRRNILLALITGIFWDTLGGRVIPYKPEYQHWIGKLEAGLADVTWATADSAGLEIRAKKFGHPQDVIDYMSFLEPEKQHCLDSIAGHITVAHGVAFLNLLESTYAKVRDVCRPYDTDWFDELRTFLLNIVPEKSGKIGIVCFNGQNAQGRACIYIKARRSLNYDGYDLRRLEDTVRSSFAEKSYLGGGGHPGAVSFRIACMPEPEFLSRLTQIIEVIQKDLV